MGVVLKGLDTELNRAVAIKVLSPHLASNAAARQRFAREARAAAAVVHDHVVAIYGIETGCELPYLVMPYVPGASLQRFVEQHGPLDVKDIVRVSMQIAGGLAAAHEQGLVHRDIKPGNVLLQNDLSRVLITDFGLARAVDDASLTRTGLVAGTPHYMSPEQANGAAVDGRSDLFSLGSVMYFMATGRPPFRADAALAVLHHICHKDARPLREVNADIPRPVAQIVSQLLEKEPAKRFRSAGQLRELLAAYLAHLQDPSRHDLPAQLAEHQSSWPRRAIAIAALAAIVVIGFMYLPGDETSQQEPTGSSATAGHRRFPANHPNLASPTGEQTAWSSTVDVEVEHELTSLSRQIEELEIAMRPTPTPDVFLAGRSWERQAGTLEQEIDHLSHSMSNGIFLTPE